MNEFSPESDQIRIFIAHRAEISGHLLIYEAPASSGMGPFVKTAARWATMENGLTFRDVQIIVNQFRGAMTAAGFGEVQI